MTAVARRWGTYSVVCVIAGYSICAYSQNAEKKAVHPQAPELRLRIIPDNETYFLHDKIVTRTEFVNLTDKTLCFPEPAQDCEVTSSGSLTTTSEPVGTGERDWFHCHMDGGGASREKLVAEIEQHWIKLAPNAAYITKSAEAQWDLSVVGQWRLKATYAPPECAFNIVECTKDLKSAAQAVGCTVPEKVNSADPVIVNVVPPPEQK